MSGTMIYAGDGNGRTPREFAESFVRAYFDDPRQIENFEQNNAALRLGGQVAEFNLIDGSNVYKIEGIVGRFGRVEYRIWREVES